MRKKLIGALFFLQLMLVSPLTSAYNVGVLNFAPPFIYSIYQGFDIDLAKTICYRLHSTCNFIPMSYQQFFVALKQGTIDFAMGAIFLNEDNAYQTNDYIYSLPYVVGMGQFMVLKTGPIKSASDLQGKVVGVLQDSPSKDVFVNFLNKKYFGQFQIKDFPCVEDVVNALATNTIAADFVGRASMYWTLSDDSQFKLLGSGYSLGDGIAIMSVPKNEKLIEEINIILKQMESDGSYLLIYHMYFNE